ncbi:MAG: arylsulfatase A-like enzyme [Pseudohongiellaceae bacterium]
MDLAKAPKLAPFPERNGPPSIVLITMDTTRADGLGCYGYPLPVSAHVDALAEEATIYTRAYSTSSWTLPAHASLLTGKLPSSHGARYDENGPLMLLDAIAGPEQLSRYRARGLGADESSLAEVLRQQGYATGAVVAGPWMKRVFGLDRGFEFYDDSDIGNFAGRSGVSVTDSAMAWLDHNGERPFLLLLNYFDVHGPFSVPAESIPEFLREGVQGDDLASVRARYDAGMHYLDAQLGRLFDHLRQRGLYDDIWIVVTSDHGELLGEQGRFGHGSSLSEAEVHIPLIVKQPGARSGSQRIDTAVQLTDVMPSLLDALGIPAPAGMQGQPFDAIDHPIVAEVYPLPGDSDVGFWRTLHMDDFKFSESGAGVRSLVNLANDPGEARNLAGERSAMTAALQKRLARYLEALPRPSSGGPAVLLDEQTREQLESLGYVK